MTKYQEYSNRILEVHARYSRHRPPSKYHEGPMLDAEFGRFLEEAVKAEFGLSWEDVEADAAAKVGKLPSQRCP